MKKAIFLIPPLLATFVNAQQINGVGVVEVETSLNIRTAPNTDSRTLGTFSADTKINIIRKTGNWFVIEHDGQTAYVSADFVVSSRRGEPVIRKEITTAQTEAGSKSGNSVVEYAKTFLGVKYVYGGTTPNGFDCSGLVQYVYKHMGVQMNRVAADQTAHGKPISRANLQPGDVVFFHNQERYSRINHVGIYVGNGNFIHAPQTGDVVKISSMDSGYYSNVFITARRIFE